MRYFGIPTCPYCKKRVNLVRTWSLKRQGEYQCPRCGGISNIYLSPLIYVFGLLAVFAGGAMYFFHKFVLDDISLSTVFQVFLPFAIFFLLSLFMVYLEKPVIKKVSRSELEKKRRGKRDFESRRAPGQAQPAYESQMFYEEDEYLPQTDYRTGPLPQPEDDRDMKAFAPPAVKPASYESEMDKTFVVKVPAETAPKRPAPAPESRREAQRPAGTASSAQAPVRQAVQRRPASQTVSRQAAPTAQVRETVRPSSPETVRQAPVSQQPRRVVTSVEIPSVSDDFFAKYDDPAYVERRLKELNAKREGKE